LQYRSGAGRATNLGCTATQDPKTQYKRFYFVDWPVLNRHKAWLGQAVDAFIDQQHPDTPTIIEGSELRSALDRMRRGYFRVQPWFSPGPWGGHWLQQQIPQLPQDAENIAWSFELIVPENGLVVHDGIHRLEVAFDWLMYHHAESVLGQCADWFGYEFPIRFDFLDTVEGGNLSVQCHPRPEYMRQRFGETFTQDETYYILDCRPGAQVYLGFQDGVASQSFRQALEHSHKHAETLDVDQYVNREPAEKHGLYLIPNGTIHCSGVDNLVLEISATPYIYTFKMYDWMRLDLDGQPRPLNIDRAMENLYFERQGERVRRELVSQPRIAESGSDWQIVHLPTHQEHFYDVHRLEFDTRLEVNTGGSPHILMLVEGSHLRLETASGESQMFSYAETFVVPAAAERYTLINQGEERVRVVKAFMKDRTAWPGWMHQV
jgi:mannose-6-phosphate isomerase class I